MHPPLHARSPRTRILALLVALLALVACSAPADTPNRAPSISLQATPLSGTAPLDVTFVATTSDPDGDPVAVAWDFGDGSSATGTGPTHRFASPGDHTVTATATDPAGASATASVTIAVAAPGAPEPDPDPDPEPPPTGNTIAGTVTLLPALDGAAPDADPGATEPRPSGAGSASDPSDAARTGPATEVIVQLVPGRAATPLEVAIGGVRRELVAVRRLPIPDTWLYRAVERAPALRAETSPEAARDAALARSAELAVALRALPGVETTLADRRWRALRIPNDPFYRHTWHYPLINMPEAWDVTVGSSATVVAVVDTGIVGRAGDDPATHPDFRGGRMLGGYDFITDPAIAGDGDGRDPDPYDLGDDQSNGTHGTHVAGTVVANADDEVGIPGMDWAARLLPLRVLGVDGSTNSSADILEAVAWAAGLSVEGVPDNPDPADVINLSLGGPGVCSPIEQQLYDLVIARGTLIAVAAGNSDQDAGGFAPASCDGVITVGATDRNGRRAPYSNFGTTIDVMAPGGDTGLRSPEGRPDGVLSASASATDFQWTFLQGTSMASPHVAGALALMHAVDPTLDQATALQILQATARPLSTAACNGRARSDLGAGDCGAGLIDVHAALLALQSGAPPPPPETPELVVSPLSLDFGSDEIRLELTLENPGSAALSWRLERFLIAPGNPGEVQEGILGAAPTSGSVPAGGSVAVAVELDRNRATVDGSYRLELELIVETDPERTIEIPLVFTVGGAPPISEDDLAGTTLLICFVAGEECDPTRSEILAIAEATTRAAFTSGELADGRYLLIAWKDSDGSGEIDAGDLFGFHRTDSFGAAEVTPPASGIDVPVEKLSAAGAATDGALDLAARALRVWRERRTSLPLR